MLKLKIRLKQKYKALDNAKSHILFNDKIIYSNIVAIELLALNRFTNILKSHGFNDNSINEFWA